MGKHKNSLQNSTMLQFMEKHLDIARGHTKRDRAQVDALWQELTETLNSQGPPVKDAMGWKKSWTDWKFDVRKKLANNRKEAKATDCDVLTKLTLSKVEESLAIVAGLSAAVDGIVNTSCVELTYIKEETLNICDENIDEVPSTSQNCMLEEITLPPTDNKWKIEPSLQGSANDFISTESVFHDNLSEKVTELVEVGKENRNSLKRMCQSMDKMADTLAGIRKDLKEHNFELLKVAAAKNDLKRRQLEIEEMHLKINKNKKKLH